MIKENRVIALSALLGILFSWLFYEKEFGISFFIFSLAAMAAFMYIMTRSGFNVKNNPWPWFTAAIIVLLSATYFINRNSIFYLLNVPVILLLFVLTALSALKGKNRNWSILDYIANGVLASTCFLLYIHRPYKLVGRGIFSAGFFKRNSTLRKVLTGICISLPLVLILVLLLSSADMVFNRMLSFIPNFFENENWADIFNMVIIALVIGTLFHSFVLNLMEGKHFLKTSDEGSDAIKDKRCADPTILTTVLAAVNIIYIVFCVIQFSYLFGGNSNTLPMGFSYAEYARRGFFELVVVTIINFCILLLAITYSPKVSGVLQRPIKALLLLMGAATYVMIYSSFYRMGLYEQEYGYTHLRILVYLFLILESLLLAGTMVYIIRPRFKLMAMYVALSLVFYAGINFISLDSLIARRNIDRYFATGKIDLAYLQTLSYDALPEITRLVNVREQEIAGWARDRLKTIEDQLSKSYSWQEYNISRQRAANVLKALDVE